MDKDYFSSNAHTLIGELDEEIKRLEELVKPMVARLRAYRTTKATLEELMFPTY